MSKQDKVPPGGSPLPPGSAAATDGTMRVEITVLHTTLTLAGPIGEVLMFLKKLFGTEDAKAVVSRLQVMFGPEVKVEGIK